MCLRIRGRVLRFLCLVGTRGKAKKGGGGGGFTWGRPGDELMQVPITKGDPNYDSQEDENDNIVLVSTEEENENLAKRTGIPVVHTVVAAEYEYDPYSKPENPRAAPKIPLAEFKQRVVSIAEEYFVSEDAEEFITDVLELQSPMLHYDLVRRIVVLSMGKKERERELISIILSQMRGRGILSIEQVGKGFERMFEIVDDIVLDVPHARKFIAQFLARCVADEVLPPAFLSDPLVEGLGGEIVEQAKVLLSIKHGLVRLGKLGNEGLPSFDKLDECVCCCRARLGPQRWVICRSAKGGDQNDVGRILAFQ